MGNKPSAPPPPVNTSLNNDECNDYANKNTRYSYATGTEASNCLALCCTDTEKQCNLKCKNFYNSSIKENFQNIIEELTEETKAKAFASLDSAKFNNYTKNAAINAGNAAIKAGKAAKGASANETQTEKAVIQTDNAADNAETLASATITSANSANTSAAAAMAAKGVAKNSADNAGIFADNAKKSASNVNKNMADISGSVGAAYKFMTDAEKAALSAEESELFAAEKAKNTKEQLDEAAINITTTSLLGSNVTKVNGDKKFLEDIQDTIEEIAPFTNLKEGFPNESQDLLATILSKITNFVDINIQATNKAVDIRSQMTHTELLAQDNNIVNNILMDYLINEEEGTNVEKVYNKLSQDSTKKMRTIQMNNYKTKVYKEYIYLLKIIILSIILLIPVLLITKLELISKNMSLAIVVALIFVVILYLGYRLYILRMRDNINFDKLRMNFDRENAEMLKTKGTSMYEKKGPLSRLGVTCLGDECCDENMVYDNLRHKCVLQENFGNFFEKLNANLVSDINIVKPNNLNENNADFTFVNNGTNNVKETFVSRNNIQLAKEGLFLSSLNNSSQKQFQKNVVPSLLFE